MQEYLLDNKINPDSPMGKALMELGSAAVGAAFGGSSGAATALAGEKFNRQLHPDEVQFLKSDEVLEDYIAYMAEQGVALDEQEARVNLDRYAAAGEDAQWASLNGRDPLVAKGAVMALTIK